MNTRSSVRSFYLRFPGYCRIALIVTVVAASWAFHVTAVWAFPTYDGCQECHGSFPNGRYTSLQDGTAWGSSLMQGHLDFIADECEACHKAGGRSEVFLNQSASFTHPKSCLGCHGRQEDVTGVCTGLADDLGGAEVDCGGGSGLRQYHELKLGQGTCRDCHTGDATPVGEHVAPYNVGRGLVVIKDTCDGDGTESRRGPTGLDNDGDGLRDGEDPDCGAESLFAINAGHSGAWYNPDTAGQGQLLDVEPESKFLFLSWFTFTDGGSSSPDEQHWFTAQGNYSDNTADLTVYETLGGRFDDPQAVTTEPVGTATLSFSDCGNGQLDYDIDTWDLQGSFPLLRAIPGTENVCEERSGNATESLVANDGRDGAWFDENAPGQGFLIDAHPNAEGDDFIFVAWFTYGEGTSSGQRWLTAQGPLQGTTADITVYETLGGRFDDPQASETQAVGTMTIDFTDCSHAMLTYSITDEELAGMIDIKRAIPGTEALCLELTGEE